MKRHKPFVSIVGVIAALLCISAAAQPPGMPPGMGMGGMGMGPPPIGPMPLRGEFFELTLIEHLDDEPRGWCVDASGHQAGAIMVGGVHGHTCYSYEGNGDYRVAEDQGFSKTDIEESDRFRLGAFDHCLTMSAPKERAWIALTPCDDRPEQGFRMTDDGRVHSVMAPEYCVTLGTQTVPGGGGSPVHQIREALLESCSEEKAHLQRWRLRDYKDW